MTFLIALFRVLFRSLNIGIKSPSKVMVEYGEWTGKDLAVDIATTSGNTSERK